MNELKFIQGTTLEMLTESLTRQKVTFTVSHIRNPKPYVRDSMVRVQAPKLSKEELALITGHPERIRQGDFFYYAHYLPGLPDELTTRYQGYRSKNGAVLERTTIHIPRKIIY